MIDISNIDKKWLVFPTNDKVASCSWNKLDSSLPLNTNAYGIRCGKTSGICVVDIDSKYGGLLFEKDLIDNNTEYSCVSTPRGYHFYFTIDCFEKDLPNGHYDHERYGPLDIRNNERGYVVGPGSVTKSGKYEWLYKSDNKAHFSKVKFLLRSLFKNIFKIFKKKKVEKLDAKPLLPSEDMNKARSFDLDKFLYRFRVINTKIKDSYAKGFSYYIYTKTHYFIEKGKRNTTLYTIAMCIKHKYARYLEYIDQILVFLNRLICSEPLSDIEIKNIIKSVLSTVLSETTGKKRIIKELKDKLAFIYNTLVKKGLSFLSTFFGFEEKKIPQFFVEDIVELEGFG